MFDPGIPFFQLLSAEVVLPVSNLTFSEEVVHALAHGTVLVEQSLFAVLAKIANVQMIIQGQNLALKLNLVFIS